MKSLKTAALAVAGVGTCALMATTNGQHEAAPEAGVYAQGAIVVRDAETNTLRAATPREATRYTLNTQDKAAAVAIRRADGSLSARLDDSHMVYTTVTRSADGTWQQACGMDHDHAQHAQTTAVAPREVR